MYIFVNEFYIFMLNITVMKRLFFLLLFFLGIISISTARNRWYVNINGTSNGTATSWTTACSDLQLVINNANSGDTIWVAQGTYKPIRPADTLNVIDPSNRRNSFVLKKNVHIYGGFVGIETNTSQRDWTNNSTILSGDIGVKNDTTDNCYTVLFSVGDVGTACLDGFTISDGYRNNMISGSDSCIINNLPVHYALGGAGIHIYKSSPKFANLIISMNYANFGAGIYIFNSSPIITNVIIENNATSVNGGGIFYRQDGYNNLSPAKLINVIIRNNSAWEGGGIYLLGDHITLANVLIVNNKALNGAGIYNNGGNLTLTNVTIINNKADMSGGGIFHAGNSTNIRNSILWGNIPENIIKYYLGVVYSNCLVACEPIGNGVILNSDPFFEDPTNGNYRLKGFSPCINVGNNSFYHPDSIPDLSNITTDLDNNPRFYNNGIVDLGAYEYQGNSFSITPDAQGIVHVNKYVSGGNQTGNSWTNAAKELADALQAAKTNTNIKQIWVARGTYYPLSQVADDLCDTSLTDRDKSFLLVKDVQVYGGFVGNETFLSQRNWANNTTVLSGDIGIIGDNTDNCYRVVLSAGDVGTACLDGFTITDGNADAEYGYAIPTNGITTSRESGGGINITHSSPVLSNLIVTNNTAWSTGGGISNQGALQSGSSPILTNVLIYNNKCPIAHVASIGGGMYNSQSSPILTNVTITNNYAYDGAGGIHFNHYSFPKIRNCIINGNTSGSANMVDNIYEGFNSDIFYSHCLIGGEPLGNGIILNSNPLFVDAANGDYRLTRNSSCLNVGNNSFYHPDSIPDLSNVRTDLDGNPRISANIIDLGVYEFQLNIIPDNNGIVYVNKHVTTGNGTGNSWYNAATELADALYFAASDTNIKQIWVAEGTYYPLYNVATTSSGSSSTDNRDKTFVLVKDVQVYGGFPTDANDIEHTTIYTRDWNVHPTILSGDIGVANDNSDNCYHVVVSAGDVGNACLDGLTIRDGNADVYGGDTYHNNIYVQRDCGGGIHITNSLLTLRNLEITNNNAQQGGGIFSIYSELAMYNSILRENNAITGGGILHMSYPPTLNATFYVNCLFLRNKATSQGGTIFFNNGMNAPGISFTNCTFIGEDSPNGELIYFISNLSTTMQFRNCVIDSLSSGNLFVAGNPFTTIDDVVFLHCITPYSSLGNNPLNTGNILSTDPMFLNRNTDDYRLQPSSPAVNAGNDVYYQPGQTPDISSVTTDLAGRPRFNSLAIDMGVHEHQIIIEDNNGIVYVNKHVLGGNGSGNSWANAAKELADALYAAKTNPNIEQIWVAQAVYTPFNSAADDSLGNGKRDNAFVMVENVKMYGGFPRNANDIQHNTLSSRNWKLYPATLSGVIGKTGTLDDTVYHVVISAGEVGDACLDGFIVSNGNANVNKTIIVNGKNISHQNGGGIYSGSNNFSNSDVVIKNTIIRNNAGIIGGGIYSSFINLYLEKVIVEKNKALTSAGGISASLNALKMVNVTIVDNYSGNNGGGVVVNKDAIFTNVTIANNYASVFGGGIYDLTNSSLQIRNSILWGNTSKGNVIDNVFSTSNPAYSNCLIEAESLGNGIILTSDPLFADPINSNFRLSVCSPAIDAGNNDFYSPDSLPNLSNITMDLDNNPRFYNNGIVDLGAYEYQGNFVTPPTVTIESDTTICYGESVDVTFTIAGGSIWDIVYTKDNKTIFDTLKNITASPYVLPDTYTKTTVYQLKSINNHICHEVFLSDEITITVLPEPTLDNILTNDTLCDGQKTKPIDFYGLANQFQWTASEGVQGIPSGTQTGNFGTYTVENNSSSPTTSIVLVTPVNTQGGITCTGSASFFNIIASPATTIQSFTSNRSIFCEGEELEMTISATGYLLSYQWYHNGSVLNGQTRNTYNVPRTSSSQSGQYYVKIKSYCGEQTSNTLNIRIDKDSVLVEKWDDVLLIDNSTEDYIGYQWYKDGIMIPGATNQFYQELGGLNGCYKVNLTLKSGKKEMTCERCLDNVKKSFSIYPNPVKQGESVNISLYDENQLHQGLMEIRLYSADGKLLQKKQTNSGNSEVNMFNFAVGIYILKIVTEGGQSYNEKIMVY
jgi:hypothetical protein